MRTQLLSLQMPAPAASIKNYISSNQLQMYDIVAMRHNIEIDRNLGMDN